MAIVVICYVYTLGFSCLMAVPVWLGWIGWVKFFGSNARSFDGVECLEDLEQLLQFGYDLKPKHIHVGNFQIMIEIPLIYQARHSESHLYRYS